MTIYTHRLDTVAMIPHAKGKPLSLTIFYT
jgi:hypothetical protein